VCYETVLENEFDEKVEEILSAESNEESSSLVVASNGISPYTQRWLNLRDGTNPANSSEFSESPAAKISHQVSTTNKRSANWDANVSLTRPSRSKPNPTKPRATRNTRNQGIQNLRSNVSSRAKLTLTNYANAPKNISSPGRKTLVNSPKPTNSLADVSIESIDSTENYPAFQPPKIN
jgi:hypothetical protein